MAAKPQIDVCHMLLSRLGQNVILMPCSNKKYVFALKSDMNITACKQWERKNACQESKLSHSHENMIL